ncbi:unnamed protein product [Discula destructiva]
MPPIPIYSHSPINTAAKADGASPQTAEKGLDTKNPSGPPPTTTQNSSYPAAQPGAPAAPAPTGNSSVQQPHYAPPTPEPTRTQPLEPQNPAPPQPNAFPVPYGYLDGAGAPQATPTGLPPPPKAGESSLRSPPPAATQPTTPAAYYPPQMSIPAPPAAASQSAQRGTATTVSFGQAPGYQQNPHAGELDRYQRAAQEALERDERDQARRASLSEAAGVDGVWGSVKGAMAAAGEKIAAAEEQVWKRINKD